MIGSWWRFPEQNMCFQLKETFRKVLAIRKIFITFALYEVWRKSPQEKKYKLGDMSNHTV